MNVFTSDFEVTTWNHGNPHDQRNKAVCLGYKWNNDNAECTFDCSGIPGPQPTEHDMWVFFNAKFDVSWFRKSMLSVFSSIGTVWCCQLAEYVISGQTNRYPSLEETAAKYGLGSKVKGVIEHEYWLKYSQAEIAQYCIQDVELTYQVYQRQLEEFKKFPPNFLKAFKLRCMDLLILQEMEWNGLLFDEELCKQKSEEVNKELTEIRNQLDNVYPDVPINFNSGDQLSAFLYGGVVKEDTKEHIGFFKSGAKEGQPKYKNVIKEHQLPQLVKPIPKSELAKDGVWATDEATLKKLKGPNAKAYVHLLLRLAELEKLNGTYYQGLLKKNEEMHWEPGMLHGQFNQVVTSTGRLSSSAPNLQNFATECQDILISRFND